MHLLIFMIKQSVENPVAGVGIITQLRNLKLMGFVYKHPERAVLICVMPKPPKPDSPSRHSTICTVRMEYSSWADMEGINMGRMRELSIQIQGGVSVENLRRAVSLERVGTHEQVLRSMLQYEWEL